jgi:hypothetical protein
MADPVTMAVVGGSVGAMMSPKDPLKGALLGAAGGYGGGALMGAGGASALGSTAGTATSGLMPGAAGAFGQAVPAIGTNAVPAAGIFSGGGTAAIGGINPMTAAGPSTGMIPSSLAETGFMDTALGGLKSAGQFAQQNPYLTQMASQTAQQMMQQPQVQMAPAGQVNRGQVQANDYMSLLNPQQGTVIRPQPISLLG